MQNLTGKKIGHGCQADVRMRSDVDPGSRCEIDRSDLIKEYERPDHASLDRREDAPYLEPANVARTRHDDGFQALGNGHRPPGHQSLNSMGANQPTRAKASPTTPRPAETTSRRTNSVMIAAEAMTIANCSAAEAYSKW